MRKIIILLPFLLLMIITLTSCYLFPKEEEILEPPLLEPSEITYNLMEVKKGDIERRIEGTAGFVSVEQKNIFFGKSSGRLEEILVSTGAAVTEGQLLAKLNTGDLQDRIALQQLTFRRYEILYERAVETGADDYSIELAKIDLDIARINLNSLMAAMEESMIYAPISGIVVYLDTRLGQGDLVSQFQIIMKLADPAKLQLQYSGSNLSEFKLGMKVDVRIGSETFIGNIIMTPANVPSDADQSMKNVVLIEVENRPSDVTLGSMAYISLLLERSEDTIIVPKNVIKSYMSRKYVILLENGQRVERDVRTGIETVTQVEVLEGLEAGEMIIVG